MLNDLKEHTQRIKNLPAYDWMCENSVISVYMNDKKNLNKCNLCKFYFTDIL